jgi:hypothetical protein
VNKDDAMATAPTRSLPRREPAVGKAPNVDRALRGVPTIAPWRNPTLWLFVLDAGLVVGGTARAELEAIGARLGAGDHRRPLTAG